MKYIRCIDENKIKYYDVDIKDKTSDVNVIKTDNREKMNKYI